MLIRKISSWGMIVVLTLVLGSCASQKAVASHPRASIELVEEAELKKLFGSSPVNNPFLPTKRLLFGQKNSYIVLRLRFESSVASTVELLRLVARDESGAIIAKGLDREEFLARISQDEKNDESEQKRGIAEHYYLPAYRFDARPGKRAYYMVLEGKYPIALPVQVEAYFEIEGLDPLIYQQNIGESQILK